MFIPGDGAPGPYTDDLDAANSKKHLYRMPLTWAELGEADLSGAVMVMRMAQKYGFVEDKEDAEMILGREVSKEGDMELGKKIIDAAQQKDAKIEWHKTEYMRNREAENEPTVPVAEAETD